VFSLLSDGFALGIFLALCSHLLGVPFFQKRIFSAATSSARRPRAQGPPRYGVLSQLLRRPDFLQPLNLPHLILRPFDHRIILRKVKDTFLRSNRILAGTILLVNLIEFLATDSIEHDLVEGLEEPGSIGTVVGFRAEGVEGCARKRETPKPVQDVSEEDYS